MSSRNSATEIPVLACLIISVSIIANTCDACAQDDLPDVELACAPEVEGNRRALVEHGGQAGMWFHVEVARCMLGRLAALPQYARQLRLHEGRLALTDATDALLRRQVALAAREADAATEALTAAVRRAREAREAAQQERDLRWLWVTGSIVVVIVLEVVAVWVFSQVRISI